MGEHYVEQNWYAPYETNASDAQFFSDSNIYYSPFEQEGYYNYP